MLDLSTVYEVRLNNTNITSSVLSFKRDAHICSGEEVIELHLISDFGVGNVNIFDEITVYEEGNLVKTFYVDTVNVNTPPGEIIVIATDIKRIRDYFISENYILDYPSTPRYWIQKFCNDAGVNVIFSTVSQGGYLSNNTSLGLQPLYDQLQTLLQIAGWYMRTDETGNLVVGELTIDRTPVGTINKVLKFNRNRNDNILRNRVVVWGSADPERKEWIYADISTSTPWDMDGNDKRTVVVANSNIDSFGAAYYIANKALKEFSKISDVITIEVPGYSGLNLGDFVYLRLPYYRGALRLTSYSKEVSSKGAIETLVFNETCPRLFAYWSWGTDYVYVATDKGIYRKMMITQSGENNPWYSYNSGIPLDDRNTLTVKVYNGLLGTVTSGGNAYWSESVRGYWNPITLSGNAIGIGVERNDIYIGEVIPSGGGIVEKKAFGALPEVVFSGGDVISIDSLDVTAFTVFSGNIDYFSNPPYREHTNDTWEGASDYYTPLKSPNNVPINLYKSYNQDNEIDRTVTGSFIVSGKFFDVRQSGDNILRYDRDTNSTSTIYTIDTSNFYYKFALFSETTLVIVAFPKATSSVQQITATYLNVYNGNVSTNIIKDITGYYINSYDIIMSDNTLGVAFILKNSSTNLGEIYLYKYSVVGVLNKVYDITSTNWSAVIDRKGEYKNNFVFVVQYRDNDTFQFTVFVLDSNFGFTPTTAEGSYLNGHASGVDAVNGIFYWVNKDRNGLKIDMNSFSILEEGTLSNLPDSSSDWAIILMEDDDYLYYVVVDMYDDSPRYVRDVYCITTTIDYGEIPAGNTIPIGIDDEKFIMFDYDNNKLLFYNLVTKQVVLEILFQYTVLTDGHNTVNIFLSGGIVWYKDDSYDYHTVFYNTTGEYVGKLGAALYMIKDGEVNKMIGLPGKYYATVGKSSIYLTMESPSSTVDAVTYQNELTYINNGLEMVDFPRETEIAGSGLFGINRRLFSISTNNPIITDVSISGIINSEYYIIASGLIDIPISGNILETSNYLLDDKKDTFPKILFSNGKDKIYENYGGTDFYDVTYNLIDDFGVTKIYFIAIDNDL